MRSGRQPAKLLNSTAPAFDQAADRAQVAFLSQEPIRYVRSDPCARTRVRLVNSRGSPGGHTREGDVEDVWTRARVEDVVHFSGPLDEGLSRGVTGGLAPGLHGTPPVRTSIGADRVVGDERALLDDDDRAARV